MTGADEALLAQIAADPDDDAPRLVYADLLAERGDPRGELIQLQCTQAGTGHRTPVRDRIGELLRAHEKAWKAAAGITGALSYFARGFPAALIGSCGSILASRAALRAQPITSLTIVSGFDLLPEVMALPELARIRSLTIGAVLGAQGRRAPVPTAQLAALARAPHLHGLRELQLEAPAVDDAGAAVLADAPWLPALEKLAIARNPITAVAMAALAARLRAMRWLALAGCAIGEAGAAALAAAELPALDFLWLPEARIGGAGIRALAGSRVLATVTRLDVADTHDGDDGARALATSPHVGGLRELVLSKNRIGVAGAEALASSTALARLEVLEVHDNRLGHAGVAALAAGRGLPALRRLGITRNGLYGGDLAATEIEAGADVLAESRTGLAARFAHRPALVIA